MDSKPCERCGTCPACGRGPALAPVAPTIIVVNPPQPLPYVPAPMFPWPLGPIWVAPQPPAWTYTTSTSGLSASQLGDLQVSN